MLLLYVPAAWKKIENIYPPWPLRPLVDGGKVTTTYRYISPQCRLGNWLGQDLFFFQWWMKKSINKSSWHLFFPVKIHEQQQLAECVPLSPNLFSQWRPKESLVWEYTGRFAVFFICRWKIANYIKLPSANGNEMAQIDHINSQAF